MRFTSSPGIIQKPAMDRILFFVFLSRKENMTQYDFSAQFYHMNFRLNI